MRIALLALLLVCSCTRAPQSEASDAEIAARAEAIARDADALVNRQIAEIDAEANAASPREPGNLQ